MIARSVFVFGLLLPACAVADNLQLKIIPLQHRFAEDVLPALQPILATGGTISGMNNQIIVRTTPVNLQEIMQVLQQVDRAMRRFKIYVRQADAQQSGDQDQGLSGRYDSANNGHLHYRSYATRRSEEGDNLQFVHAMEGQLAVIDSGQSVPLANQTLSSGPYGTTVNRSVQYRNVTTGFDVVVRAVGDHITLQVAPHHDRMRREGGGGVDISSATTTISGRLGEWLELGGIDEDYRTDTQAFLRGTHHRNSQVRNIAVKVEEVR